VIEGLDEQTRVNTELDYMIFDDGLALLRQEIEVKRRVSSIAMFWETMVRRTNPIVNKILIQKKVVPNK
jgi:hypothetical protein